MRIYKDGGRHLFSRNSHLESFVSQLLIELERDKMDAVRRWSAQLDGWSPDDFVLSDSQITAAAEQVSDQTKEDIAYSQGNVRFFAEEAKNLFLPMEVEIRPGITLGHRHIPISNIGSYVPGGTYPLFGSAQMCIIPAKVAGSNRVAACTPPSRKANPDFPFFPETIYAMHQAGADQIYLLGGIPAIALMAFGLDGSTPADLLCGAGNEYVEEAKRQLYGRCGIDLLAGPSELLVISDGSVSPEVIACDILSQAEHGTNAALCLICFQESFAKEVEEEIHRQLKTLPTAAIAEVSWHENGKILIAEDRQEAVLLANDYSPEHLEILVSPSEYDFYLRHLNSYGELYIGEPTTVAYGDKSAGTNHILPTGRAARYTGGVWVGTFLKTVSYQKITEQASPCLGAVVKRLCDVEQMPGHALAAALRIEKYT